MIEFNTSDLGTALENTLQNQDLSIMEDELKNILREGPITGFGFGVGTAVNGKKVDFEIKTSELNLSNLDESNIEVNFNFPKQSWGPGFLRSDVQLKSTLDGDTWEGSIQLEFSR